MKIGILGSGQLGRMLALAGFPLGLEFVFLDKIPDGCAQHLGEIIVANFSDESKLKEFCDKVDVVTYESENIPLETAKFIAQYKTIQPNLIALKTAQDRLLEKQCFNKLGISTAEFFAVDTIQDLDQAAAKLGFPFILKTRHNGYDGKNQFRVADKTALEELKKHDLVGCIAEAVVKFEREISIIAVRSNAGEIRFYDICENKHEQGILRETRNIQNDKLEKIAQDYAKKVLEHLNHVGVLVIEFFVVGEKLLANEMAPRVHNSGHWTIEGAVCSQFENHLRAIVNLPLGETRSLGNFLMKNIIGEMPDKNTLLKTANLHMHDYTKKPRVGRKLGHTTQLVILAKAGIQDL